MRSKNQTTRRALCALLAVMVIFGATGCSSQTTGAQVSREIQVEIAPPATGDLQLTTDFIGNVEPAELVSVFSKVPGTVAEVHFKVGEPVKKGDLLFTVDPTDVELQVNVAKAALATAEASVSQALGSTMDSQLLQAEASLKSANNAYKTADNALEDYYDSTSAARRQLRSTIDGAKAALAKATAATAPEGPLTKAMEAALDKYTAAKAAVAANPTPENADELDKTYKAYIKAEGEWQKTKDSITTYSATIAQAEAQLTGLEDAEDKTLEQIKSSAKGAAIAKETAEKAYDLLNGQVKQDSSATAKAQLAQAQASYDAALKQLEYTKVYAPIDGVVEQCAVTQRGMVVQSSPAFVVSNKSQMQVTFHVSADAVQGMSTGDPVTVESGSRSYGGTITEIGTMVDPSTGLFKVKAMVAGDAGGLLTGLSVKVKAVTAKANESLLVDQSCVYYDDGQAYVYTYADGTAHKRYVQTGIANTDQVVVTGGLDKNTQLITTWHPNLMDGAQVVVAGGSAVAVNAPASQDSEASAPQGESGTGSEE